MTKILKIVVLGSGCSSGVPRVDGYWGACDPANPKNRRSRCSAAACVYDDNAPDIQTQIVIDTAPEFREQVLRAGIRHLDAILWTHDHADQTHGIDDMRFFAMANQRNIDGYMDRATYDGLFRRFEYVFTGKFGYPPICTPNIIPPHGVEWQIMGNGGAVPVKTFEQEHGPIKSVGYRIGDVAYSSDVSDISDEYFEHLKGLKLWIVDALRLKPHSTHSHVEKTLGWIERVKPERAILTNLHQDLDYTALKAILPRHVEPAYDGLTVEIPL
ncbi:MBL fold metallo-hydrolase [Asticcacaulis machinosus]|uniref:MBL fold metallo-hydrolase n=1 Tax=Asticcacaulis machinosus TaxID=2984211 RepID=A0ABT5HF31_9CAUL|nr:MBL fold metallo-hydrolase [Asticcacaulis machinosus]MDC7674856.1 MBL fold metallo-hydrolase [Asticcacaulis machinosus]